MAVPEIDVTELATLREKGVPLIDVRREDEFAEFRVPGARLIPLDQLGGRLDEVPSGETVYVICRSGARSAKAVEALNANGYDAVNVAGGSLAWVDAGHPVESDPA